jgi:hypothetical protein
MEDLSGCQIPCLPKIADGKAHFDPPPIGIRVKRALARPWNYHIKKYLKRFFIYINKLSITGHKAEPMQIRNEVKSTAVHLQAGDWVRVKSIEEIQSTLNRFKELKGCAFLEDMKQYCNTEQRVFKVLERFLDERDYQVKKAKGIVLLEGVFCQGTPVFGRCDRSCLSFWREEWLEKISRPS